MLGANFEKAALEEASFINSILIGASFEGSALTNVDFRNAILIGANFKGAFFYDGFVIEGAVLYGAKFDPKVEQKILEQYGEFRVKPSDVLFQKAMVAFNSYLDPFFCIINLSVEHDKLSFTWEPPIVSYGRGEEKDELE